MNQPPSGTTIPSLNPDESNHYHFYCFMTRKLWVMFHSYFMKMSTHRRLYTLRKPLTGDFVSPYLPSHLLLNIDLLLSVRRSPTLTSGTLDSCLINHTRVLSITLQVKLLLFFYFSRRPPNGPTNVLPMPRHWDRTQVPETGHKVKIIIIY